MIHGAIVSAASTKVTIIGPRDALESWVKKINKVLRLAESSNHAGERASAIKIVREAIESAIDFDHRASPVRFEFSVDTSTGDMYTSAGSEEMCVLYGTYVITTAKHVIITMDGESMVSGKRRAIKFPVAEVAGLPQYPRQGEEVEFEIPVWLALKSGILLEDDYH